ncbi:hypothetical protein K402DRAFT_6823 [Aulographum hederae CBS 113979]|uniref:Uncharacterized protein n=1 Tax=Aulographum hederae CBS 113979 TaxID=1176131 RepID=A0A6G1HGU7_9PEZI|nr:hypothetical protein K402DRAFT_6823 [Aulographum hederae CBS 113979]
MMVAGSIGAVVASIRNAFAPATLSWTRLAISTAYDRSEFASLKKDIEELISVLEPGLEQLLLSFDSADHDDEPFDCTQLERHAGTLKTLALYERELANDFAHLALDYESLSRLSLPNLTQLLLSLNSIVPQRLSDHRFVRELDMLQRSPSLKTIFIHTFDQVSPPHQSQSLKEKNQTYANNIVKYLFNKSICPELKIVVVELEDKTRKASSAYDPRCYYAVHAIPDPYHSGKSTVEARPIKRYDIKYLEPESDVIYFNPGAGARTRRGRPSFAF